jgi:UDPglucose 6-dehydrogenase
VLGQPYSILVVGTGYVGLTTGACLASVGHKVVCVDKDDLKIRKLQDGMIPIYEPSLSELVFDSVSNGRLNFAQSVLDHLANADFIFLCLPTPVGVGGFADLSALEQVCNEIRNDLKMNTIIVNKSTAPVNTVKYLKGLLRADTHVVTNPEFLREGSAVNDFLDPDRIVIGCDDITIGERVANIYSSFDCPVLITNPASAEAVKYFANAFLALKISFINEASEFCHAVGADILDVKNGLALDKRIGEHFMTPGPGWGGSCFPKDLKALVSSAGSCDVTLNTVESAITANQKHLKRTVALLKNYLASRVGSKTKVAVLGLTFKANTDDTRESPAISILRELNLELKLLSIYDPMATNAEEFSDSRVLSIEEALSGATHLIVLTEWSEFRLLDPARVKSLMAGNQIFDTRYVLDKKNFSQHGLTVFTLG